VVFKHNALGFHKDARPAAIASMAAARQGHFWKYHDVLFANAKALKADDLNKYAEDLGLDMAQFKADMADKKVAMKVDNDQAASVALGATGTPAFFVNGVKLSGAKPFADFKTEIEKQLATAKELQAKGTPREKVARALALQSGATATNFVKYLIDEKPAPKQAAKKAPPKKQEDTKTVWKVPVDISKEAVKGPKHAQVTIVEVSDFECPFCAKTAPTYKKIMETYGDKVRVFFKHTPLAFHKNAPLAHEASLAAGAQGKFWEMHDMLFENQKKLTRPDLDGYAELLGLNMGKFKKALDKGTYKAQIAEDMAMAEKVQAKGTPNHFINGRKLTGAKPFEEFKAVIDEEIKKTDGLLKSGTSLEDLYSKLIAKGKTFNPLAAVVQNIANPANAPSKGSPKSNIVITEYTDYQ
jgi:protein-disulfide isomerase